jgi:Flp pilus assembly protein TadD
VRPAIATETATKSGVAAAVDQYKTLRKQYYGGQSYDFSDAGLVTFANTLTNANKADDAIAFLTMNAEFYPSSAATYAAMGQAYNRKNDKENAIKNLEKAVQLDPNNQQAKRMLDQLKASK